MALSNTRCEGFLFLLATFQTMQIFLVHLPSLSHPGIMAEQGFALFSPEQQLLLLLPAAFQGLLAGDKTQHITQGHKTNRATLNCSSLKQQYMKFWHNLKSGTIQISSTAQAYAPVHDLVLIIQKSCKHALYTLATWLLSHLLLEDNITMLLPTH